MPMMFGWRWTRTCATPVLTRPIEFGADFVCHSASKFLNGHSDVLAGMLVAAADSAYWQRIRRHRLLAGAMLGSMEAWLLLRGLRTLYLRVRQQSASALALASWLAEHPGVEQVFYPGLPRDPGHEIACRQMSGGFGGMLSILVPGGRGEGHCRDLQGNGIQARHFPWGRGERAGTSQDERV